MKTWPVDWPRYKQSSELCDMLVGDCSCGAQHQPGEFELRDGVLYRYECVVPGGTIRISKFDELKIENEKLRAQLALKGIKTFINTVIDIRIIARDMLSNTREFSFSNVESVAKIKEMVQTVLDNTPLDELHHTIKGVKAEGSRIANETILEKLKMLNTCKEIIVHAFENGGPPTSFTFKTKHDCSKVKALVRELLGDEDE